MPCVCWWENDMETEVSISQRNAECVEISYFLCMLPFGVCFSSHIQLTLTLRWLHHTRWHEIDAAVAWDADLHAKLPSSNLCCLLREEIRQHNASTLSSTIFLIGWIRSCPWFYVMSLPQWEDRLFIRKASQSCKNGAKCSEFTPWSTAKVLVELL